MSQGRAALASRPQARARALSGAMTSGKELLMTSLALLLVVATLCMCSRTLLAAEVKPADPDFGPNVLIFDPSVADIQPRINAIFAKQESAPFAPERYAYLFKPGKYDLDVQVGFYTHVAGLGKSPDDVSITGAVRSKAQWMQNHNATCNFWRCVENLSVT